MYDLLLKNGQYPDFESGEMKAGNIGIQDGKIAYIGNEAMSSVGGLCVPVN